jgi:hypothetical protein
MRARIVIFATCAISILLCAAVAADPSVTNKVVSPSTNQPSNGPGAGAPWKIYKHATGLSVAYPPDWEMRMLPQCLQLIPPDAGSNDKGATEAYLVFAGGAEGVTSADDPRAIASVEGPLLQVAPFLRRAGQIEKIHAGSSPGICITWEGTNPDGMKVKAEALCTVLKGYGLAAVGLGETKSIEKREKILRSVFASFSAGSGQKDPQLVGAWKFWSYSGSASGNYSTERTRFMNLQADGTAQWSSRSESAASVSGKNYLGQETFNGGVVGNNADNDRGTWSAGDGKLYILWQNGSTSDWNYQLSGAAGNRRLMLKGADQAKPDEWVETR